MWARRLVELAGRVRMRVVLLPPVDWQPYWQGLMERGRRGSSLLVRKRVGGEASSMGRWFMLEARSSTTLCECCWQVGMEV
jgi:hypothetical protein